MLLENLTARDALLRRVAKRRNIVVPSLVADVRVDTNGEVPEEALDAARETLEEPKVAEPQP